MALILTRKGLELLQKLQVDEIESINFSGVAVGDGLWQSGDINLDITALKSVRIKTGIGNKKTTTRGDDTIVTISATLDNKNITDSFYVREVGLYAMDGEIEILYAYDIIPENEIAQAVVQSNIVPQYIPIILDTALSNIDKVNITVTDDINFVITSEFEEYKMELENKFNNKSDKDHNHENVYSKLNHSHNFSSITGTIDINDSRIINNLPIDRVTGAGVAPNFYTTSEGDWAETVLSNGRVMLEGWGERSLSSGEIMLRVSIPKSVFTYTLNVTTSLSSNISKSIPNLWIIPYPTSNYYDIKYIKKEGEIYDGVNVCWYFKGIAY